MEAALTHTGVTILHCSLWTKELDQGIIAEKIFIEINEPYPQVRHNLKWRQDWGCLYTVPLEGVTFRDVPSEEQRRKVW